MNLFPSSNRPDHLTERPLFANEKKFAATAIAVFQYAMVAVFLFLVSGYWELQVLNADFYRELAQNNRIKSYPLPAARGRILDRDGRVIVDNSPSYRLLLSREVMKEEHLPLIARGLDVDYADLLIKIARYKKAPRYIPLVIKERLTPADLAFVEANRNSETFPELEIAESQQRIYPKDNFLAHTIGYVGEVSDQELDMQEFAKFRTGDTVGKTGVERYYNETLYGQDGQRKSLVNSRGKELAVIQQTPPRPGKDIQLTIDLDVQAVAELALEGKRGAIVALDPRNGEVLAMASRPAFDPNQFTAGVSSKAWKEILENPEKPMLNRSIQAQLAPGSTFKPVMALAGLEEGVITPSFNVVCTGTYRTPDRDFHCHARGGHGRVQLSGAMAFSCDSFFYTLGTALGIERISKWGEIAGLGRKTGIDLPGEQAGDLPSVAWKQRRFQQRWLLGDTVNVSIGQGYLNVTPLQLAHATGGITTGGVWQHPHLFKGQVAATAPPRAAKVDLDHVQAVISAMCGVTAFGTARVAALPGIELCGKTGTSQLISNETLKLKQLEGRIRDNAWFVGFAPRNNAEIVVAALFEGGDHGDRASILVRDVVKAYFDKKARTAQPAPAPVAQATPVPPAAPEAAR